MRRTRADRALELTLLFALVIHVAALGTMATMLLPGIPGAGLATTQLRLAYIVAHPLRWHLGWFPWHLCALSDLLFSTALLFARWIPKRASVVTIALTVIAFGIEQYYETLWDVCAPHASAVGYAAFEHRVFFGVCAVAASLYALMAAGWSWSLSALPTWTRTLTLISVVAWPVLLLSASAPIVPPALRLPGVLVTFGNQLGFGLMTLWFVLALEAVLRRTRVTEAYGRMSFWRAPRPGAIGWACELIANSRFLQYVCEFGPRFAMSSDIRNVVYVNYVVEAEHLLPLVPSGLTLQTLGDGRYAMLTMLMYQHGAFGPSFLGSLRARTMPSPLQSNWRIYVREPQSGTIGVFFFSTAVSQVSTALCARVLSRGVSMHVPERMELTVSQTRAELHQSVGQGSALDLHADLRVCEEQPLPSGPWSECFASQTEFLAYCVPQSNALSVQSWDGRTTSQQFDLEGASVACVPLAGEVRSQALLDLCGNAQPVCMLLPRVDFYLKGETTVIPGFIER